MRQLPVKPRKAATGNSGRRKLELASPLLLGAGAAMEQAVVGETPNPAARRQALAEPGAVVIAASTRR